jgi:hypothetical protein
MNTKYLEISFDSAAVRDSQKRLKSLITELAVDPLKQFTLTDFDQAEDIVSKRVAAVIAYWCRNKHVPVSPKIHDKMSDVTNTSKGDDDTLEDFYIEEVRDALDVLGLMMGFSVPEDYEPKTDELEYALLEMEEKQFRKGGKPFTKKDEPITDDAEEPEEDEEEIVVEVPEIKLEIKQEPVVVEEKSAPQPERAIVSAPRAKEVEVVQKEIHLDVLNLTTEHAWNLIYGLIGYSGEYIQQTMLPRWQQNPETFEQDRRFLYGLYIDTIRNAAGVRYVAGNFMFSDQRVTLDQMWNHYFSDLSQRIAPQLAAAKLNNSINDPWHKKLRQRIGTQMQNMSPIWILALVIALIFDGLTTYIALDQTPMEGPIVLIFSVLITALFQIADQLVINYRHREFEAEAIVAKYKAQTERIVKTLQSLEIISDSYVRLSMEKSQSHANWKAAEDNRKMARRGRFWSARIADINVIVTAYGFAFLFLNGDEPMYAVLEQIDAVFIKGQWEQINIWVFLMVGLAVTVSFVVNTAQRTEILGWSMNRMKKES